MRAHLHVKVWAASLLAVGAALILWACQKEKYPDENMDAEIAQSAEMENYIVAGYELQAALNEFQNELSKVDFSKLEFVPDTDGKSVMHLPFQTLDFDTKLRTLNERKQVLQSRFPELASFASERREGIIESCIAKSVVVSTKLLDMGINVFQPMTKRMIEPWMDSEDFRFLINWSAYSGDRYVEAMMIVFADGRTTTYIGPGNTPISASLPYVKSNGNAYFANDRTSPIRALIHTHSAIHGIAPEPSAEDLSGKIKGVDNITYGILYQGTVREY